MLIDKHRADNIYRRVPGLTIKMNPELAAIDLVLEDDDLFRLVYDDLAKTKSNDLIYGCRMAAYRSATRRLIIDI